MDLKVYEPKTERFETIRRRGIAHSTAMMRIARYLSGTGTTFKRSKSIHDRIKFGEYHLVNEHGGVIKDHLSIEQFMREECHVLQAWEFVRPVAKAKHK